MTTIDGSFGEGGGQILRTSLALSLVTGVPFRIENIRAGRKKPGLRRQHLTAANAAAEIGQAEMNGAAIGSQQLTFGPKSITPGAYRFSVGTAGSCTLVLQTVLPALLTAFDESRLVLEGGTHNPHAPPFDFLTTAFLPIVNAMGARVVAKLKRPGFYPAGGGRVDVNVLPAEQLRPIELLERGEVSRCSVRAVVSNLPEKIAEREVRVVQKRLSLPDDCTSVAKLQSDGPGNAVMVEVESEHVTELFTGFGQRGVPAEAVARTVAKEAERYLEAGVPVGERLADQLLIPVALAGGGAFRTTALTDHTRTNIGVVKRFLDVDITADEAEPGVWEVAVSR